MIRLELMTSWIGSGTHADPYRPALADAYPGTWRDTTGQPTILPEFNVVMIEVITDPATAAQIEADPRFVVLVSEAWNEG